MVGFNSCSLSLCYHLLVGVYDAGYLFGVLTYSVGECPALDDVEVIKRYFYCGYLLVADVGCECQRPFFELTSEALPIIGVPPVPIGVMRSRGVSACTVTF